MSEELANQVLDRKYGFYLNLVAAETAPTGSYPLSGIPEYLAVGLKPHVEELLSPAAMEATRCQLC